MNTGNDTNAGSPSPENWERLLEERTRGGHWGARASLGTALSLVGAMFLPLYASLRMKAMFAEMGVELPHITIAALSPIPPIIFVLLAAAVVAKDFVVNGERTTRTLNVAATVIGFALILAWILALFLPLLQLMSQMR